MYQLATILELHHQQHSLGLYCLHCDRWSDVNLTALICGGHGEREIARTRFRCVDCGQHAEKQVRPPVPEVSNAVAYI